MRRLLILAILLSGCTSTPTPTPTPNACLTRVAVAMQTVDAAMATYVPLATAVATCCVQNVATITPFCTLTATLHPTWTPAVTSTPLAECRPCRVASECPTGTTCYGYGGVLFCVDPESLNGNYRKCLEQLYSLSYEGPPDEEIDLDALVQDATERRFEP